MCMKLNLTQLHANKELTTFFIACVCQMNKNNQTPKKYYVTKLNYYK